MEFFGNTGLGMEQLSNPMIITAPDSSFMEDQKYVLVNHGTGGHCTIYKCGRYGHNNCMAHLQEKIHDDDDGTGNSGSFGLQIVLHTCTVSNSTLAESRQYYLLALCANHIRVMPDDRLDGAGHIIMK